MGKVIISVIVPVYNCEKYIKACIESILNQSFLIFELIIIDDGSTDRSGEICEQYAKNDSRVRVFHQFNTGVAKARSNGVEISRGDYISFIDSDDYIDEKYLEILYKAMKNRNTDVVCCNCIDCDIKEQKNICIEHDAVILDKKDILQDYFLGKRYVYNVWAKLFKKDILKMIPFVELKYSEDTHFILNFFMECENISLITYAGYYYRYQANSVTMSMKLIEKYKDYLVTAKYVCNICKNIDSHLYAQAQEKLSDGIYGAIAANVRFSSKNQLSKFNEKFLEYFEYLDNKNLRKSIKGNLIFLYYHNHKLTKYLLKIYYTIRRNK
ncbi:glycosyltransferase family 2 protein [Clostridium lacusfryxellense]|uniref:glycosyltransferase family 2 protein n=1 Tax=Clostridium lacusfryxellense TaxID=205328 RepID=UPI001C0BE7A2|nr:glycosyltransferase family 2 protein [Clostridium lacusfryxellense]MBU3111064.1 glycosyltransferase [Clostridium lacusfryxellense]